MEDDNENVELKDFEVFLQMVQDEDVSDEELDQAFDELDEESQNYIAYLMEDEEEVETGPQVVDLVSHAVSQDALDFQKTFDEIMSQKLEDAIAEKKLDVAQTLFSGEEPEEEEEVEYKDEVEDNDEDEVSEEDNSQAPHSGFKKKSAKPVGPTPRNEETEQLN
jgi:hypothetical protein